MLDYKSKEEVQTKNKIEEYSNKEEKKILKLKTGKKYSFKKEDKKLLKAE